MLTVQEEEIKVVPPVPPPKSAANDAALGEESKEPEVD